MKNFPILYKYTSKGQIQQWSIFAENDRFWTEEGIQGGKLTTSLPTICEGKNVGRSNETSPEEQALKEAQAKWQKKVDSGYNEILTAEKKFFEPMLAHEYEEERMEWPAYVQPKLDGLRCANDGQSLRSRNGKLFYADHLLHGETYLLDGELYNHEYKDDFNSITGLFKREPKNRTPQEAKDCLEKGQMWVYDFPSHPGKFSERYAKLEEIIKDLGKMFVLVPTYKVNNHKEVRKYHKQFMEEGYEGTIVRLDKPYENKRSRSLLKFKDWQDAEFEILGYEEGTGGRTGTIGNFLLSFPEGKGAKIFKSNVKGSHDFLKEVWKNRDSYIGKKATVEYQNLTPVKDEKGGVPRFPYVIKIDRDEYE